PDWKAAIARAREHGNGFGPIRGFRRLYLRLTGVEVAAPALAYQPALDLFLAKLARTVDIPHHEAALRLHGLDVSVVPAKTGRALDQRAAARAILASFASFSRAPVALPFRIDKPRVTTAHIRKIAVNAHTALSAPVRLALGKTRYEIPRWRVAGLLKLPSGGAGSLAIAGKGADEYFARLAKTVDRAPEDARFQVV